MSFSNNSIMIVFGIVIGIAFVVALAFRIVGWVRFGKLVSKGIAEQRRSHGGSGGGAPPGSPPGWYSDQDDPRLMRYYDGRTWTSATAPRQ